MTSIISLSKKDLSDGILEPCSVVPADAVLSGNPEEAGASHFETADGKLTIGTWECTPYAENLSYPNNNEFCLVLSGRVALTDHDGTVKEFGPGDSYIVPKGFEGKFEVLETLRKVYVLYNE